MRTIHIVSHTHWDREWYLPFQLIRLRLIHLVDGLLELLEQDPDYKYFMLDGQTIILDDYLEMRPENTDILRQHISKGRILIGPWHILPDMFLVGPEAHIRNLLQGDRTAGCFGQKMMVGYMPDSFGHISQFPQILQGFGIQVASVWRGVLDGPNEFWWQSPDGSKVLMAHLREGYGNGADLPAGDPDKFASLLALKAEAMNQTAATPSILVMYGTDHMEPPVGTSRAIAISSEKLATTRVIHSSLPEYISSVADAIEKEHIQLVTIQGELRDCKRMHLLPGVLSSRMWIKQRNAACENLLTRWVEPFTVFQEETAPSNATILKKKSGIIRGTWRLLMENHPHDSICGCSVDQVHDEMKVRFDQVDQMGEEIVKQALITLTSAIDTTTKSSQTFSKSVLSLVVFNPLSHQRTDVVTGDLELPPGTNKFIILDDKGSCIPFQQLGMGTREIIHMDLDGSSLRAALGNIHAGRAAGMSIQDIQIYHMKAEATIAVIMADGGEPNLEAWEYGLREIETLLNDPSVKKFHVAARSISKTKISLVASAVPGFGYRTYWVCPVEEIGKRPIRINPIIRWLLPLVQSPYTQKIISRPKSSKAPYIIENDCLKVEAKQDGTFLVLDKRTGYDFHGLNQFLDGGDCGDEYNYSPPPNDLIYKPRVKQIHINRGEVQQSITMILDLHLPKSLDLTRKSRSSEMVTLSMTTRAAISNGVSRVDFSTRVENTARDHRLRVHFPAPFATRKSFHDGHFEIVERKTGIPDYDSSWVEQPRPEVPQRAFTCISDGLRGMTIANRGLPEVEVFSSPNGNSGIALTLLRCTGWLSRDDFSTRKGHAGPFLETPGAQEFGTRLFEYAFIPHHEDWTNSYLQAYAFSTPMHLTAALPHPGILPSDGSFIQVMPDCFHITAIKPCEYQTGWLIRGVNLISDEILVTLKPWKFYPVVSMVNLAEKLLSTISPQSDGSLSITVRGHEIVSVRFSEL